MPKLPTVGPKGGAGTPPKSAIPSPEGATPAPIAFSDELQRPSLDVNSLVKKLPDWLQDAEDMPGTTNRVIGDYLGFASTQSLSWGDQANAGLKDGQMYAYHQQLYHPIDRLDFFLVQGAAFQTLMVGREGRIDFVTTDMSARTDDLPKSGTNVTQPHYVTLLIIRLEGALVPIKGDFRGTKSGGIESAIKMVQRASSPDWGKMGDAAKVSLAFPLPFGRVFHTGHMTTHKGKQSGNPYYRFNSVSRPSTPAEMQMLIDHLQDESFVRNLNAAQENYRFRVDQLFALMSKDAA